MLVDLLHDPLGKRSHVVDCGYLGEARPSAFELGKLSGGEDARSDEQDSFSSLVHGGIIRLRLLFA